MTKNKNANCINDYNNFLLTIDNKNKENKNKKDKLTINTNIKSEEITKSSINEIIKNIEKNFIEGKYNSTAFSGWDYYDVIQSKLKINNENNYVDFDSKVPDILKSKLIIHKKKVIIEKEINCLNDLLELIEMYPLDPEIEYNINMTLLHNIKEPLTQLNKMIGMKDLKINILDQILYFVQELNISNSKQGEFMHTVIYGPPGTGKTEIAKIIGKIFAKMGILKAGTFKKVIRADLVSGYLGQTALKTKDVIKDCLGGVLFIDEVYSLGNPEKRDSFSKECIDTLCEALSDHKDNLMVIIAGYETEMKECFFAYNQGLESRFIWRFKTDKYNAEDLKSIFIKKVEEIDWKVVPIDTEWFQKNMDYFKFYGRDIEVLLSKIKIVHSKRVFCKPISDKKMITQEDLNNGLKSFTSNDEVASRKNSDYNNRVLYSMYL